MSSNSTTSSGGINLFGLTFVVLLVLKLTGWASISWFWVFFPLLLIPILLALYFVLLIFTALIEELKKQKRK